MALQPQCSTHLPHLEPECHCSMAVCGSTCLFLRSMAQAPFSENRCLMASALDLKVEQRTTEHPKDVFSVSLVSRLRPSLATVTVESRHQSALRKESTGAVADEVVKRIIVMALRCCVMVGSVRPQGPTP